MLAALAVGDVAGVDRTARPARARSTAIPRYWHETADWLTAHNTGTPTPGRVLVVPGAPFATQVWGTSHDEPLQVLGDSPWGVRDSIPLTPPQTIRALDSVQRLFAAGRPSAGLADTLARQGISYRRGAQRSGPGHLAIGTADPGAPGDRPDRPAAEGRAVRRAGRPGHGGRVSSPTAGCGPRYPAVEIYRVVDAPVTPPRPISPTPTRCPASTADPRRCCGSTNARRLHRPAAARSGAADRDAAARGQPAGDRWRPSPTRRWPARPTTAASTTTRRRSAPPATPRHTFNRVPDYPAPGADTVYGGWTGGRLTASSSSSDSTALPDVATRRVTGRGDRRRLGDGLGVQRPAVGGRPVAAGRFRSSGHQQRHHHHAQRDHCRRPGPPRRESKPPPAQRHCGSTRPGNRSPRRCPTARPRGCGSPRSAPMTDRAGVQFAITDLSITQYDATGFAHPINLRHTALVPAPPAESAVAQWDLGSEPLGRPGCAKGLTTVQCAPSMALAPETPATFSRTLNVPRRRRCSRRSGCGRGQGPKLADLVAEPGHHAGRTATPIPSTCSARPTPPPTATPPPRGRRRSMSCSTRRRRPHPDAAATDRGGRAAADAQRVGAARPSRRMVAVDLGDGPQVDAWNMSGTQNSFAQPARDRHRQDQPARLERRDRPHRTGLRSARSRRGSPRSPHWAPTVSRSPPRTPRRNRARDVTVDCEHGPIIAIAGRFVHTSVAHDRRARCWTAHRCRLTRATPTRSRCPPGSRNW